MMILLNLRNIIIELNYQLPAGISKRDIFIADIAGRDSIASLMKILDNDPTAVILPSIIEIGCEYGQKTQYRELLLELISKYNVVKCRILPAIISDANDLWRVIAGGHIQESIATSGFFSPCVACHLVMHIIRIKIAKNVGLRNVVSGERELHSGKEKINQIGFVLDFYNMIYTKMGVNHHLPLRFVDDGAEINQILDVHGILPVQLKCLFTGNYYEKGTFDIRISREQIGIYLDCVLSKALGGVNQKIHVKNRLFDLS